METHNPPPTDEAKSMDAIRDLLFGQKTKEINNDLQEAEKRLRSHIDEIEKRLNNRFDALEQYVKGEIGSTKEQFSAGQSEADKKANEAGEKVKSLGETLNERFSKVEESVKKIEEDGRNQLFERTKSLSDEIAENTRRINEKLDGELGSIRETSAKKNDLSEMLIELGMRMQPGDQSNNDGHHHG